jgi:type II secretory ATPase GspE/PulE/Tfp pilus assembly ATPase PilB-like protein
MNCEQFQKNLVAYLRDELLPKEKAQMDDHASTCWKCKNELDKTQNAMRLAAASEEAPVIRLVYAFIQEAIKRDASDLHFEERGGRLKVRCRADGVLTDMGELFKEAGKKSSEYPWLPADADRLLADAAMARLKIMADVDPAACDVPQKGRIGIIMDKKEYSLAVSFMPVDGGQDAVCRIIPRQAPFTLDALGMSDRLRASIERMIGQPCGVVLVGGPTGSGKTTVALALAQHLASPSKKIVTVEDPVFYKMENVTQIEVADHKGLTASALLSRVIWLDPDIIVAPAVIDGEAARKVADLAFEGRLVIAPIHSDDAAEAVWEFAHMPTDRMLPYSCIVGATNQRLVRKICADCRKEYTPSPEALRSLFLDPSSMKFEHGAGCEKCHNAGYKGRAQIMEALDVNTIADALAATGSPKDFYATAHKATSPTLVEDGRQKVLEGVTTAEEVCRVLSLPR